MEMFSSISGAFFFDYDVTKPIVVPTLTRAGFVIAPLAVGRVPFANALEPAVKVLPGNFPGLRLLFVGQS